MHPNKYTMHSRILTTLKWKCHHFDEIFIMGCTGSCYFDNLQCQWCEFHQHEDITVSVNIHHITNWDKMQTFSTLFSCMKIVAFKMSLKIITKVPISNMPPMLQIMVWHQTGDKHYLNQWWPCVLMHIWIIRTHCENALWLFTAYTLHALVSQKQLPFRSLNILASWLP